VKPIEVGLLGNPNAGKTTLFNCLTGTKQSVGNWPGVTVEKKTGNFNYQDKEIVVVDLPGIYSLAATSLDEKIARDYLISEKPDLIINIVDASNLERNLYLTVQLIEMGVPVIVALNMMDIAKQRKLKIDILELETHLGCSVIPLVANKGKGIIEIKNNIIEAALAKKTSNVVKYRNEIEEQIKKLIPAVQNVALKENISSRWLAVKILEDDETAIEIAGDLVTDLLEEAKSKIESRLGDDPDIAIADGRYGFINGLYRDAVQKKFEIRKTMSDSIDTIILNRILGIPIFLLAMYLTFTVTINIGGCFIDFFDIFFGAVFVDGFGKLLEAVHSPAWLVTFLADGIGGGVQTMSTFIPPIGFMFLCLSILEDSGYMARAAFIMDRFMRYVGLPGKSFVPLLVGFGCSVPAIMATRTLENERDRTLTIMMVPFMSCGAKLPLYALFVAAFFPYSGNTVVFGLYLTGILMAIMTGFILKSSVLKGKTSHFIMELPTYHLPTARGILIHTYDRLKQFMFRAGKVLLPLFIILTFLNSMGTDGTFGHSDSESSMLSAAGKSVVPIFRPMGLSDDNWPAAVGIFTGIFAKEAVIGTLDSLYKSMDGGDEGKFNFLDSIREAFLSIPANFAQLGGVVADPLGMNPGNVSSLEAAAEEQEVSRSTFGAMIKGFDGKVGAIAYLLFILIYYPCLAAIAAIFRETNISWTFFAGIYTTLLAWVVATIFYQLGTFSRHPVSSLSWTIILSVFFMIFLMGMKKAGNIATLKSSLKKPSFSS